jgi:hypothetical protein
MACCVGAHGKRGALEVRRLPKLGTQTSATPCVPSQRLSWLHCSVVLGG